MAENFSKQNLTRGEMSFNAITLRSFCSKWPHAQSALWVMHSCAVLWQCFCSSDCICKKKTITSCI